jgi:hypothetical protein
VEDTEIEIETHGLRLRARGPADWVVARMKEALALVSVSKATPTGGNPKPPAHQTAANPLPAGAANKHSEAFLEKSGISAEMLEQVFHHDGATYRVLSLGASKKATQTINAYLLTGIGALLATGETTFKDDVARDLCKREGCYDKGNHSSTLKAKSKLLQRNEADDSWTLTAPGKAAAATLVQAITKTDEKS